MRKLLRNPFPHILRQLIRRLGMLEWALRTKVWCYVSHYGDAVRVLMYMYTCMYEKCGYICMCLCSV